MSLNEKFSIAVLVLLWGAQIFRRSLFIKCVKPVFIFGVFGSLSSAFYAAFLQYQAFLPPFKKLSYFIPYVGFRFFAPIIAALFSAFAFKIVCEFLNRRHEERFFEREEGWLLALGIFLSGYPGFLFYIPLMLIAGLFLSLLYHFSGKGRAPLFYAWLPMAIFAILIENSIPSSLLNFLII